MRVVFFGTPGFAVPTLNAIAGSRHVLAGVVTQPDRPRGRGQHVIPSPVKSAATTLNVPVLQPEKLKNEAFLAALTALNVDIGVVAAYGKLLPQALLDIPRAGLINVHASLLPRWRGAAPIHRAVVAGDTETGITIMRVVLALDAGPMLARTRVTISPHDTSADLEQRLASAGAALLVDSLDRLEAGDLVAEPQDEALVTYAHRLERTESQVDWTQPAHVIHNRIRGLQPWPMAAGILNGIRLRFVRSEVSEAEDSAAAAPGTIVAVNRHALTVATGQYLLHVTHVQPDGRGAMSAGDFLNGKRVDSGDRFDPLPQS